MVGTLGGGAEQATVIVGACPRLVGRDLELRVLSSTAAAVEESGARLVVVTGEAGAGKSRLIHEFLDTLPSGWSHETFGGHRTTGTPAGVIDGLLGAGEPRPVAEALIEAIEERGASPMALAIEDLHWLDPAMAEALPEALTALARRPVLVVVSYRLGSHPLGSRHLRGLAAALRHPAATELRLGPLTAGAAIEMAAAMGCADPEAQASRVHARTGGNPYFLEELLRSPGPDLPWTVAEAVHERVATLSEEALRLATLLACAAEPLEPALIEELGDDLANAAGELVHAGLAARVDLRPESHERPRAARDGVVLRHALVADALLHRAAPGDRASLHRLLAIGLERWGASPARLARHWHLAGEAARAAPYARAAADRLSGQAAYAAATDLYEIAFAGHQPDGPDGAALLERAAGAAAMAERVELGRAWVRLARSIRPIDGTAAVMSDFVNTALLRLTEESGPSSAIHQRPAPSSALGSGADPAALLASAAEAVGAGDPGRGQRLAREAFTAAAARQDHAVQSAAALALANAGDPDTAAALLDDLAAHLADRGQVAAAARTMTSAARPVWMSGDATGAIAVARRASLLAARCEDPLVEAHVRGGLALLLGACGEIGEASTIAEDLLTLEDPLVTGIAQAVHAMVAIERDQLAAAAEVLAPLLAAVEIMQVEFFTVTILGIAARLALLRDEHAEVLALLTRAEHRVWSPAHEFAADHAEMRARAELALGDVDAAQRTAIAASDLAHHRSGQGAAAVADLLAGLTSTSDTPDDALRRVEQAAHGFEKAGRWPQAAAAWGDAAELARRAHLPADRATELLGRGEALVARWGLTAVGRRLAAVAGRIAAAGEGVPDVLAPLSPREREMALLVAAGLSNREIGARLFISEKTVRNHLSTALSKLGLRRRTEVAALLARSQPGT